MVNGKGKNRRKKTGGAIISGVGGVGPVVVTVSKTLPAAISIPLAGLVPGLIITDSYLSHDTYEIISDVTVTYQGLSPASTDAKVGFGLYECTGVLDGRYTSTADTMVMGGTVVHASKSVTRVFPKSMFIVSTSFETKHVLTFTGPVPAIYMAIFPSGRLDGLVTIKFTARLLRYEAPPSSSNVLGLWDRTRTTTTERPRATASARSDE